MTDLMQEPGTGPETPPGKPSEDRARQMVAAYEEETPTPVIENPEPTTADLEAHLTCQRLKMKLAIHSQPLK